MLLITCTYITVEKNLRYSSIDEKFSCSFDAFISFIEVKVRVLMNVCLMFVCCLFVCFIGCSCFEYPQLISIVFS